jgi:hypothetical protein
MSVTIKPTEHENCYSVNGKTVYKDMNNNWVQTVELTTAELNAFNGYKKSIPLDEDEDEFLK